MLQCGFLVFFMQCGFALLEAGSIRHKNTRNILLKNGGRGGGQAAGSEAVPCAPGSGRGMRCAASGPKQCLLKYFQASGALCSAVSHKIHASSVCPVIDACVSSLAWWAVGYAFAMGRCGNSGFIGEGSARSARWAAPALHARLPNLTACLLRGMGSPAGWV